MYYIVTCCIYFLHDFYIRIRVTRLTFCLLIESEAFLFRIEVIQAWWKEIRALNHFLYFAAFIAFLAILAKNFQGKFFRVDALRERGIFHIFHALLVMKRGNVYAWYKKVNFIFLMINLIKGATTSDIEQRNTK